MSGSKEDENEGIGLEESPKKPVENPTKSGKKYRCFMQGCDFETDNFPALNLHLQKVHQTVISKKEYQKRVERGEIDMSAEAVSNGDSRSQTDVVIDLGDKSRLKGRIRQMLKKIASLPKSTRDELIPEMEQLKDFIRALSKPNIPAERIREIESAFEYEIKPEVENYFEQTGGGDNIDVDLDATMRVAKLRAKISRNMNRIMNLPDKVREEHEVDRIRLEELQRKLSSKDISPALLDKIENIITYEIEPNIPTGVEKKSTEATPTVKTVDDLSKELMNEDLEMKKVELQTIRLQNMIEAERARASQLSGSSTGVGNAQMAQVVRPVIDPATGKPVVDSEGKVVTEVEYRPVIANDMSQMMQMMQLMGQPKDNGMKEIMAILIELIRQNHNNRSDETLKAMNEMWLKLFDTLKSSNKDDKYELLMKEIEQARQKADETKDEYNKLMLATVMKELEETKRYAYRDTLEELERQKERLERLGIVGSPGQKSADELALEKSTDVLNKVVDKFDTAVNTLTQTLQPLLQAQAEVLKSSVAPQQKPLLKASEMTESDKEKVYQNILSKLEELDEEG